LLLLAIPLLAGLSVAHGLVPPHPGPMVAVAAVGADVGWTILYSLAIGAVTTAIAGPLFGRFISARLTIHPTRGVAGELVAPVSTRCQPTFALALLTILLPILLMMSGTFGQLVLPEGNALDPWMTLLGDPVFSLLAAVLFSFYSLGYRCGLDRRQILNLTESSLAPVASALLVIGAGGGFNRVLLESGVGDAIAGLMESSSMPPLVLGWLIAAAIRIATGSATVAITTAAGIMAPIALSGHVNLELLVIAMGAGSLILSHVNDGGFWLVKEYFGFTVGQTLMTWTVMETILSVVALALTLALDTML
jgi:gluconate:H+ symporter, GntP family